MLVVGTPCVKVSPIDFPSLSGVERGIKKISKIEVIPIKVYRAHRDFTRFGESVQKRNKRIAFYFDLLLPTFPFPHHDKFFVFWTWPKHRSYIGYNGLIEIFRDLRD